MRSANSTPPIQDVRNIDRKHYMQAIRIGCDQITLPKVQKMK